MTALDTTSAAYLANGGTLSNGAPPTEKAVTGQPNQPIVKPILTANFPTTNTTTTVKPSAVLTSAPAEKTLTDMNTANTTAASQIAAQNVPAPQTTPTPASSTSTPTETPSTVTSNPTTPDYASQINDVINGLTNEENTPATLSPDQQTQSDQANTNISADNAQLDPTVVGNIADTISKLQNGTMPLTASEQALVAEVASQAKGILDTAQKHLADLNNASGAISAPGTAAYYPAQMANALANSIKNTQNQISTINNRIISNQAKLSASLQAGDLKTALSLSTQINDDIKNNTTTLDNLSKDLQAQKTEADTNARDIATDQLKAITDNETMDYHNATLAIAQSNADEKAKTDAQTIIDDKVKNAIDEQKANIAQSTFNATYGAFLNPDGSVNTNADPTKMPGYTLLPNGVAVIDSSKTLPKIAKSGDIAGMKVVSPANIKVANDMGNLLTQINSLQTMDKTDPSYITTMQQINNQITAYGAQPAYSALKGLTVNGGGIFSKNSQNITALKSTLNTLIGNATNSTPPPYGQIFQTPSDAQKYFISSGQSAEYQNEVTKANTLAQSLYGRDANDGEILQLINGQ